MSPVHGFETDRLDVKVGESCIICARLCTDTFHLTPERYELNDELTRTKILRVFYYEYPYCKVPSEKVFSSQAK